MESTETGSIDDSLDAKNLEASVEDIVVANYEDCKSEVLSSQTEEDQSGEQVYGYLEVQSPGGENATIYLDPQGFNLNGQRLILTQNDDGNVIIGVVSEDPDGQPLEQTISHASVIHSDEVHFENDLKEHGALVVDEQSQRLEFIKSDEVVQEHEERHVYIENSGEIINIKNDNQCSAVNPMNVESPLWSVSNNAHIKNDNSEMLFIPNPTVVMAPEETKHRKLMQLAYIAHELQSADQKNSTVAVGDSVKETESPLSEFENSVIVSQRVIEKNSKAALAFPTYESAKCLPSNKSENDDVDFSSKPSKSHDFFSLISATRLIDNAVSVIHTTSSEVQDSSLENPTEPSSPSDFSSAKHFHNSESELPSGMLYSSNIARVSFHDSLDGSSPNVKQLQECTRDVVEEDSRLSLPDDSNESKCVRMSIPDDSDESKSVRRSIPDDSDESKSVRRPIPDDSDESKNVRMPIPDDSDESKSVRMPIPDNSDECKSVKNDATNRELALGFDNDDSPIAFIENAQKFDTDTFDITEENPPDDANADMIGEDDSEPGSCIIVVEEEESKGIDEDSNMCVTTEGSSASESLLPQDTDISQRTSLRKNEVPIETVSELNDSDNEEMDNNEHLGIPESTENKLPFNIAKDAYNCKPKVKRPVSPPTSLMDNMENKKPTTDYQSDSCESDKKQLKSDNHTMDENSKSEPMDFEHLDSDLVIAESANEDECNTDIMDSNSVEGKSKNFTFKSALESNPTKDADTPESPDAVLTSNLSNANFETFLPLSSKELGTKEVNNESNLENSVSVNLESNKVKDNEDFSNNEETLVKPPRKTYIRNKVEKNITENKSNIKEKIELFSVEDFNFSECDKEIKDIESALNSERQKESPSTSKDNTESDDYLLLSDVQSKVSATYHRKKKSIQKIFPKQSLPSPRSLRSRASPSGVPLENGIPKISDSGSKKNSIDSDNIPWGDVLLKTSFQLSDVANDTPSTSFASQSPPKQKKNKSLILSPEQQQRKNNKYKRDFDRLLNSPPATTKRLKVGNKKLIPRGRKKSTISASPSDAFLGMSDSEFQGSKSLPLLSIRTPKSTKGKKTQGTPPKKVTKEATIQYINPQQSAANEPDNFTPKKEVFQCSSCCNFATLFVDNLIEHLKYCSNRQPLLSYKVNDMDKRQRIRGETFKDPQTSEEVAAVITDKMRKIRESLEREVSPVRFQEADEDLDFLRQRAKYGYSEDDVVWVKYKDRFWPALIIHLETPIKGKLRNKRVTPKRKRNNKKVCDVKGVNAYVRLIKYPEEVKGLKVKHGNIRAFDDFQWNKLCLNEAENLPNNEIFVKAVQSSEVFMRRKFLKIQQETGKEFFSVDDEVDFVTDSASSDSIVNEDSDSDDIESSIRWKVVNESTVHTARHARYEMINMEKILDFILEGQADNYVLDIFNGRQKSKKHSIFSKSNEPLAEKLNHRPWFGPCVKPSQQELVYSHFLNLYNSKIGDQPNSSSYLLQVWIPEALVKAISVVENISLKDAECLLESEDSLDTELEFDIADTNL